MEIFSKVAVIYILIGCKFTVMRKRLLSLRLPRERKYIAMPKYLDVTK